MDLDEKIVKILNVVGDMYPPDSSDIRHALQDIRQAFTDAGYVPEDKNFFKKAWSAGYNTAKIEHKAISYMTGQEWYDRFEKLVDKMEMQPLIIDGAYLSLAREAAGLND